VRQVLGAVAQFEKATTVAKLAAAQKRKRIANGKCEGRKSFAETRPEVVRLAKALARKKPKGGRLSLRKISTALAKQGHLNERGKPFNPKSVAVMLAAQAQTENGGLWILQSEHRQVGERGREPRSATPTAQRLRRHAWADDRRDHGRRGRERIRARP
jgi:hypothetical protein